MGQYKSQYTGPQIDAGINAALNPDVAVTPDSDALVTSGAVADALDNIDPTITSDTDTTLNGILVGNGSKVGTKSLDTSSLTNDADHVPSSSVVKSALTSLESDLASIHATGTTNTTGAKINAGTYFYLNGTLVRAKADIAVNATFTSGTNYETVTAGGLNSRRTVKETLLASGNETSWTQKSVQNINDFDFLRFSVANNAGTADISSALIPVSRMKQLANTSSTFEVYAPLNSGRRGAKAYYSSDTSIYFQTVTSDAANPKYNFWGVNI